MMKSVVVMSVILLLVQSSHSQVPDDNLAKHSQKDDTGQQSGGSQGSGQTQSSQGGIVGQEGSQTGAHQGGQDSVNNQAQQEEVVGQNKDQNSKLQKSKENENVNNAQLAKEEIKQSFSHDQKELNQAASEGVNINGEKIQDSEPSVQKLDQNVNEKTALKTNENQDGNTKKEASGVLNAEELKSKAEIEPVIEDIIESPVDAKGVEEKKTEDQKVKESFENFQEEPVDTTTKNNAKDSNIEDSTRTEGNVEYTKTSGDGGGSDFESSSYNSDTNTLYDSGDRGVDHDINGDSRESEIELSEDEKFIKQLSDVISKPADFDVTKLKIKKITEQFHKNKGNLKKEEFDDVTYDNDDLDWYEEDGEKSEGTIDGEDDGGEESLDRKYYRNQLKEITEALVKLNDMEKRRSDGEGVQDMEAYNSEIEKVNNRYNQLVEEYLKTLQKQTGMEFQSDEVYSRVKRFKEDHGELPSQENGGLKEIFRTTDSEGSGNKEKEGDKASEIDFDSFPDPYDMNNVADQGDVEGVYKSTYGNVKETYKVYKPDENGRVMYDKYTQTFLEGGAVWTEYNGKFELDEEVADVIDYGKKGESDIGKGLRVWMLCSVEWLQISPHLFLQFDGCFCHLFCLFVHLFF